MYDIENIKTYRQLKEYLKYNENALQLASDNITHLRQKIQKMEKYYEKEIKKLKKDIDKIENKNYSNNI